MRRLGTPVSLVVIALCALSCAHPPAAEPEPEVAAVDAAVPPATEPLERVVIARE